MSEDRDYVTLGELAEMNPESLGTKTPEDYVFKYIDLSSVSHGSIDIASLASFRLADAPSRARRVVRDGDVLFGTVRPQLRSHARVVGDGFVASTGFSVMRSRPGVADSGFLGHYLLSEEATRQAARREVGSNYPAVTEQDVASLRLPRIPLEEQRRIAEILDMIDECILAEEKVITKYKVMLEGLTSNLLDLEHHHDVVSMPICEVAKFINGFAFKPSDFNGIGLPVIRIQQLLDSNADTDRYSGQLDSRYRIRQGDVIMSWSGTIAVSRWTRGDAWLNQHLFRVDPLPRVAQEFLYHLLSFSVSRLAAFAHGTTMRHITKTKLDQFQVLVPSLKEQVRIAEILDTIVEAIEVSELHLAKFQRLRSGIATDLLSGRVRMMAE